MEEVVARERRGEERRGEEREGEEEGNSGGEGRGDTQDRVA
jgi:hypothetical protein